MTRRPDRVVVTTVDGLDVTRHAVRRWRTRSSDPTPESIGAAWHRAVPVGADGVVGTLRLYATEDLLLIARDGVLRTALPVADRSLHTSHLVSCSHCGHLWHPGETDQCPWCAPAPQGQAPDASPAVTHGGERP